MITICPGVKVELDDDLITALLESEGLKKHWESIKRQEANRVMFYTHKIKKELWVLHECLGVPGDEGLHLMLINESLFGTAQLNYLLHSMADLMQWDASTLQLMQKSTNPRSNN